MLYFKRISLHRLILVRRAMLWAALVGLFASTYLFITYVTGAKIACGIVSGCELVRASVWARTFGIPRPALGVLFYGAIIVLLIFRAYAPRVRERLLTNVVWFLAFVGFIESGFLTLVQWIDIKAFCLWCILSAVCATILFALSFFDTDQTFGSPRATRELTFIFMSLLLALIVGGFILSGLLGYRGEGPKQATLITAPGWSGGISDKILPPEIPVEGPATSTVTIVEFVDLECPSCFVFYPTTAKIRKEYAGRIRFAYRLFMLPEIHPHAKGAAIAAACASKQGKYYDYLDAALLNQKYLERKDLERYANSLHLDIAAFNTCLDDPAVAEYVENERKAGEGIGVKGTPTVFVNNNVLDGVPTFEQLKTVIEEELGK